MLLGVSVGAGPCSWIRPLYRPQTQRRVSGTSYSTSELLTGMRADQIWLCNRGLCIRSSLRKIIACSVAITKMQLSKTCFSWLCSSVYGRLLPHLMVDIYFLIQTNANKHSSKGQQVLILLKCLNYCDL